MRSLTCAVLLVALLAVGGCGPGENPGEAVGSAELAPDFTLPSLDGGEIVLSELRGKTVIVDFWATWCPPCVFQVPELNRLQAAHREAGDLVVVGVSVDVGGADAVRSWVKEQGVEYRIALGDEDLAVRFGAVGFPTLVVVTPDGRIDSLHVGLIEYGELEELVARLSQPPASRT